MMAKLKILLILLGLALLSFVILFKLYEWKIRYAFYGNITGDLCLQQKFNTDVYNIVKCSSGFVVIDNVYDWIVEGDFIYGTLVTREYFITSLNGEYKKIHENSLTEFNDFLTNKGLRHYDMGIAENPAYLLYNLERKF